MERHNIIVIGSSAGGVFALRELARSLPSDIQACILIVQHVSAQSPSYLPGILSREGALQAVHPTDGQPLQPGRIYIAPPDHHMLVDKDKILVRKGPKENRFRPSIDALMRSAAYHYGPRVIGVVLTGMLDDGTSGLWSVKHFGGTTIIQDPEDALYPDMPRNVLEYVAVDYTLPLSEIGPLLGRLAQETVSSQPDTGLENTDRIKAEIEIASQQNAFEKGITDMGERSDFTCPECGGTLTSIREGRTERYRCHTGHAYSSESLLVEILESVEARLWQGLRGMEEAVMLLEKESELSEQNGNPAYAEDFTKKAEDIRSRASELQNFIVDKGIIQRE